MRKRIYMTTLFLAVSILGFAQSSVNDYQYVIVPNYFDFLKGKDKYQLNTLTNQALKKYGFIAIMEDEVYPEDLSRNNCLALHVNVLKKKAILNTKLIVQLINCKKEIIFTSAEGSSREKSHNVAYNLALREAFKSFEALNYEYVPNEIFASEQKEAPTKEAEKEIAELKKEIKTLKEKKKEKSPKNNEKSLVNKESDLVTNETLDSNQLIAGKNANGYYLSDQQSNIIYTIKKTSKDNIFLVQDKNAILYKSYENWILEYYKDDVLVQEKLNIKF